MLVINNSTIIFKTFISVYECVPIQNRSWVSFIQHLKVAFSAILSLYAQDSLVFHTPVCCVMYLPPPLLPANIYLLAGGDIYLLLVAPE